VLRVMLKTINSFRHGMMVFHLTEDFAEPMEFGEGQHVLV
jgi:hypothetical protein